MSALYPAVDLGPLGFDGGAHVLLKHALSALPVGSMVEVQGTHAELVPDLAVWCRQNGHRWVPAAHNGALSCPDHVGLVHRGRAANAAWVGAERAGAPDPTVGGAVVAVPAPSWGLAARGAAIEPGGPTPTFRLNERDTLWTDRAAKLYQQATAAQWDPATAIDWHEPISLEPAIETAVVQLMTYLVENEEAALVVPARFLGQVHPHFREIQQVLAVTVADEARHIEVFTRRATLTGTSFTLSGAGGRASLQTLLDEPDFAVASFLLSVMGEGTFVSLLGFVERHGPDPITRRIAHLTRQDEARHVAFALSHLERHVGIDPDVRTRLAHAVEKRHGALQSTAGLNDDVFDALVVLAAGAMTPDAIAQGWKRVQTLQGEMDDARRGRLTRLGFSTMETEALSSLHTRNFM